MESFKIESSYLYSLDRMSEMKTIIFQLLLNGKLIYISKLILAVTMFLGFYK
jgi:hypothetical protein